MRGKILFTVCLCIGFVISSAGLATPQDISVRATVETDKVVMGEPFRLEIEVRGVDGSGRPQVEAITDFSVESLGGRNNNRSSIMIVNGQMTKETSKGYVHLYRLKPKRAGRLVIPPIPVPVGSQTMWTRTIPVEVSEPEESDDFKLDVKFSKTRFYTGEPIIVVVTWYIGRDIEDYAFNIPVLALDNKDFIVDELKVDEKPNKEYYRLSVGGTNVTAEKGEKLIDAKQYITLSFSKVLTAKKSGVFDIPGSMVSCSVVAGYPVGSRRGTFDSFSADDFFSLGRRKILKTFAARSKPERLTVLDLPVQGRPSNFSGNVGRFEIEASARPTEVNVGDPITLSVSVSGSANPERIEFHSLTGNRDFAGQFKIPEEMAPGTVQDGAMVFTQTLRAQSDQVTEIPALELSYFDPELKEYRTAKSLPIPLKVKPTRIVTAEDVEGIAAAAPVKNELEVWGQGIAYNYEGPDVLERVGLGWRSALRSPVWLSALILPFLSYVFLSAFVHIKRRKANAPDTYRSRRAIFLFRQRVRRLRDADRDGSEIWALLLDAVRRYLGDKLAINGASATFSDVEGRLKERGIDSETIRRIEEIFSLCEAARYSGGLNLERPLDAVIRDAVEVFQSVDRALR